MANVENDVKGRHFLQYIIHIGKRLKRTRFVPSLTSMVAEYDFSIVFFFFSLHFPLIRDVDARWFERIVSMFFSKEILNFSLPFCKTVQNRAKNK